MTGASPTTPDHATDAAAGGPMFELRGVSKRYGSLAAADELSLAFARGTITALIGNSGSGKSTVLRMLVGLVRPDAGTVRFDGVSMADTDVLQARRRIGYVIQEGGLFPHLTAAGNLALLPHCQGWERARIDSRVRELASLAHLPPDTLDRYPAELSGGQRQRVALMRALMADPPALLLDEPLGALDPVVRHELQDELRRIFRELGKTVIVVTHDIAEAAWLAPRLVLMRAGRVVQDGSLADLRERPADDHVRRFLGSTRALPGAAS